MSLTMNMIGGGSGIPGNRAVLVARIPSGSTVTATKGGVTLTPMMWVSETYPDQDIALFVFTPAQFDSVTPWTITSTDGTSTASDTVLITTNKEYEITLSYDLYIIQAGNLITTPSFANATVGDRLGDYWYFGTENTNYHAAYIRIDVTRYAVLTATIYPSAAAAKTLGVWTQTTPTVSDVMSAYTDMQGATTNTESTWTFSLSALTGEQTVGVRFGGYGSSFGIKELALKG